MNNKRWYDFDPTLALAINLLQKSEDKTKDFCAEYIIKKGKSLGIRIESDINTDFNFVWQRKTDSSSNFNNALEYMKQMDSLNQKEVSLYVLKYLNEQA